VNATLTKYASKNIEFLAYINSVSENVYRKSISSDTRSGERLRLALTLIDIKFVPEMV